MNNFKIERITINSLKMDKIVFTDENTDFFVDSQNEKVYARAHTLLDIEQTGTSPLYGVIGGLVIVPFIGVLSGVFTNINPFVITMVFVVVLALGNLLSWLLEKSILKKQILGKEFIRINDVNNLNKFYKRARIASTAWSGFTYFVLTMFIFLLMTALINQDSATRDTFLILSQLSLFAISFMIYRFYRLNQAYRILKKLRKG